MHDVACAVEQDNSYPGFFTLLLSGKLSGAALSRLCFSTCSENEGARRLVGWIQPITEVFTHYLQNIESATKSLQNMESLQHTMVHNESNTIQTLNLVMWIAWIR